LDHRIIPGVQLQSDYSKLHNFLIDMSRKRIAQLTLSLFWILDTLRKTSSICQLREVLAQSFTFNNSLCELIYLIWGV
uniref:Ovule protein n=1 Tax=Rodentolepis nana TaxID=102285 RepID=A0A0R3TZE8_RODNA